MNFSIEQITKIGVEVSNYIIIKAKAQEKKAESHLNSMQAYSPVKE